MDSAQTFISVVSGGLAGACVNAVNGRIARLRLLRTQFHPILNNLMGAYAVRMLEPEGRYLMTTIGKVPLPKDDDFVDHRTAFLSDTVQFNELKETRELRQILLKKLNPEHLAEGEVQKSDLLPEYQAVLQCLGIVQKKLKLD
jgi:hypothetical protein